MVVGLLARFLPFIGGVGLGASAAGGGGLIGDVLSPEFDFSRTIQNTRTTSRQTTITDARQLSIITGSPNARAGLQQEVPVSPQVLQIPTVTRDIGIPVQGGSGGTNFTGLLIIGGLIAGGLIFLNRRKKK